MLRLLFLYTCTMAYKGGRVGGRWKAGTKSKTKIKPSKAACLVLLFWFSSFWWLSNPYLFLTSCAFLMSRHRRSWVRWLYVCVYKSAVCVICASFSVSTSQKEKHILNRTHKHEHQRTATHIYTKNQSRLLLTPSSHFFTHTVSLTCFSRSHLLLAPLPP